MLFKAVLEPPAPSSLHIIIHSPQTVLMASEIEQKNNLAFPSFFIFPPVAPMALLTAESTQLSRERVAIWGGESRGDRVLQAGVAVSGLRPS